jgi:ubiquinone/menaquinone biosynthesis C-methylase UbiE
MILNELIEVLLWDNIQEYIDFSKANMEKYLPDNDSEYFKQRNNFLIDKIKSKENFIKLIEYYSINGKADWHRKNEMQNCTTILRSDIVNIFNYGTQERGEELFQRYINALNTWAIHLDEYGKIVNCIDNTDILELSIGAGLGTCAVLNNLSPNNRMISIDIDFVCVRNADGLAKYFKVDDRVCGLNANFWNLPFDTGIFDTICTHYGLDESREIPTTLNEASRVLKSGGRFIIIARGNPYIRQKNIMDLFDITEQECCSLLKKARMYSGFDSLVEFANKSGLKLLKHKSYDPRITRHYPIMYVFQK